MARVKRIYVEARTFPKEELFGLSSQMRRSAVSIPCNIAEGQGRLSKKEFKQFVAVSRGSLLELQTQLQIAADREFISAETADSLMDMTDELLHILNGLIKSLA